MREENMKMDNGLAINWSRFKSNTKGNMLEKAKQGYIEFCKMLNEVDFELVSDYVGNRVNVKIVYKFDYNVKLKMSPNSFKRQTYKYIINFKNKLIENNDEFIKFIGITEDGNLIAKIKTSDGGNIDIDIGAYDKFNNGRQGTYNYCKEKGYKVLSSYINNKEKILIDFNCGHKPNWIIPNALKNGYSCPICNESKGEKAIRLYLENNNIKFIQEYRFEDCRYKYTLPFDFYIPEYNLCIEFDGVQHFEAIEHFGGGKSFKLTKNRDKIKNEYCKENDIELLRIPYWEIDNIESILDEEFDRLRKLNRKLEKVC